MNTTQVGIAGDWHGDTGWAFKALKAFADAGITDVLHVGDFGIWPGESGAVYIRKIQKLVQKLGITLRVAPGNHEDYVRIGAVPVSDDGWQHYRPNILLAPRGHRWVFAGKEFVFLGGANSIDRNDRTPGISWWAEEQISLGDVYRTVSAGHADYMITHECPSGVNPLRHGATGAEWSMAGLAYAQMSSDMMRQAVDSVKPRVLFHGHYHWFHDTNATLNDGLGDYTIRVVGMDMNNSEKNAAVFDVETETLTILDVS